MKKRATELVVGDVIQIYKFGELVPFKVEIIKQLWIDFLDYELNLFYYIEGTLLETNEKIHYAIKQNGIVEVT